MKFISHSALDSLSQLKDSFLAVDKPHESGLEGTVFHNGIFLDYFGPSTLKSHLNPSVFVIDVASKVAAVPKAAIRQSRSPIRMTLLGS